MKITARPLRTGLDDPVGQHRQRFVLEGLPRAVREDQRRAIHVVRPLGQRLQTQQIAIEQFKRHYSSPFLR